MTRWLRNKLTQWLLADHEGRIKDIERHFVHSYGEDGSVKETLADVPLDKRKGVNPKLRGMNMQQRLRWLEATDGGRRLTQ